MPMCAVPGCTSGYASNPERVHCFKIPQNPTVAKQWLNLINRAESDIKSRRYVCQNHFLKSEIMWLREHCDLTGRVYGVTTYKVPRLKPGTLPSLFAWDDLCTGVRVEAPLKSPLELRDLPHESPMLLKDNIPSEKLTQSPDELTRTEESIQNAIEVETCDDTSIATAIGQEAGKAISHKAKSSNHQRFCLDLTKLTAEGLSLPSGWVVQRNDFEGSDLFSLVRFKTTRIEERYQVIVEKSITLADDSSVEISAYSRPLNPANFDLPSRIQTVEILQDFVLSIDRLRLCTGLKIEKDMQEIHSRTLIQDALSGNFRHINCVGLLPNTTICQFCRTAKKILANKLRRWKQNDSKTRKALLGDRKEWSKLQAKCRKAIREKCQALQKNKTTKSQLQELRLQTARLTRTERCRATRICFNTVGAETRIGPSKQ